MGVGSLQQQLVSQTKHIIDSIKTMPCDMDDASDLLERLSEETMFTSDQRREIASVVASLMQSLSPGTLAVTTNNKTQHHHHFYNYCPESLWTVLLSSDVSFEDKMDAIALFGIQLGLRYPDPTTRKDLIALICVASKITLEPDQSYSRLFELKDKFDTKRKVYPGQSTLHTFPADVADFQRVHGHLYKSTDPPVPTRVDPTLIRELAVSGAVRSTNRRIQNKSSKDTRLATRGSQNNSTFSSNDMIAGMFEYMMRKNGGQAFTNAPEIPGLVIDRASMTRRGSTPRVTAEPVTPPGCVAHPPHAIADRAPASSHAELAPPSMPPIKDGESPLVPPTHPPASASDPHGLDSMTNKIEEIVARKKHENEEKKEKAKLKKEKAKDKTMKVNNKKAKEAPTGKDKGKVKAESKVKKETAKAPKKQSKAKKAKLAAVKAAVTTDSSSDDDSDNDSSEVPPKAAPAPTKDKHVPKPIAAGRPALSLEPTAYAGGRIYFSNKKGVYGTFRCYCRKTDVVEKTISVKSSSKKAKEDAWRLCCEAIENDPRTR